MSRFRRLGPLTVYSWGWDFKFYRKLWLVYSFAEGRRHLYLSSDATPPCDGNWGKTLWVAPLKESHP